MLHISLMELKSAKWIAELVVPTENLLEVIFPILREHVQVVFKFV